MGAVIEVVARRWRRWSTATRDAVLATGLAGVVHVVAGVSEPAQQQWWAPLLLVSGCVPLVLRRRHPVAVALAVGALAFAAGALLQVYSLELVAAFAVGSAAYHRGAALPWLLPLSAAWMLGYAFLAFPVESSPTEEPLRLTTVAVLATAPVVVGHLMRLRADRTELRIRAVRAQAQRERFRERARIARDVHDITGHHLSAVRLLAVGGRQSLNRRDEKADEVLGSIADVSGRAVQEMRELLDLMRDDRLNDPPPPDVRLDDLPLLAAALEDTGVTVELAVSEGVGDELSAQVEADAYRIVQESLGNVLRHSSARHVRVGVCREAGNLAVTVDDDGTPPTENGAAESSGSGLAGMRERTEALGGRLDAGFRQGRGWRVRAVIPADGPTNAAGEEVP